MTAIRHTCHAHCGVIQHAALRRRCHCDRDSERAQFHWPLYTLRSPSRVLSVHRPGSNF